MPSRLTGTCHPDVIPASAALPCDLMRCPALTRSFFLLSDYLPPLSNCPSYLAFPSLRFLAFFIQSYLIHPTTSVRSTSLNPSSSSLSPHPIHPNLIPHTFKGSLLLTHVLFLLPMPPAGLSLFVLTSSAGSQAQTYLVSRIQTYGSESPA